MSKSLKSFGLPLGAFLLLAASASAQVTTLEGYVKDDKGAPIVGAKVILQRTDIKGNYVLKSDKKGHYGHYGLPIGTYNVSCEVDGKQIDQISGVKTSLAGIPPQDCHVRAAQQTSQTGAPAAPQQLPKEVIQKMSPEEKAKFEKSNKDREAQIAKNKALNDTYTAGKDALQAKNYDLAVENLKKASEMDPSQNVIWSQLAEAYVAQAGTKPAGEQEPIMTAGLEAYKKAIEMRPEDAALRNNYGLALVKAKKIPEAQEALNKAAEIDPANSVRYFYNLGAVLINSNQTDAAATAFKKAISSYEAVKAAGEPPADITKNYADSNYQYGITLLAKAQTDPKTGKVTPVPGTIEAFNTYLQYAPDGGFAQQSKDMISMMGGSVATVYQNPDASKKKKK